LTLRVLTDSTFPPLTRLSGQSPSQEVNAGAPAKHGGVQVSRERREMPYRLWIAIHGHGDVNLRRSYIHTGSIRVQAIWG